MTDKLDLVAIGNAIVDVLAQVDNDFLAAQNVEKGIMTLVDQARATDLYGAMPTSREVSGGSAANTAAGAAALGARAAFIGKVRDDELGQIFAHDIRAIGVQYSGPTALDGADTSRCLVLVSPDGERSMSTYLGASVDLVADDIDIDLLERAKWLYLEGYLFDTPEAKAAYSRAIWAIKKGGGKASITLSDPFCVDRHRADFRTLIKSEIDLLFANKAELFSLCETDDLDAALNTIQGEVEAAVITLSEKGAVVVRGDSRTWVKAEKVSVVDTTGAGDLFAAGFLAGLAKGADDETCATMGCAAAGAIIGQIGARPEMDLNTVMPRT
ncbi:MAG: adenosine kinase [Paracoccaceae bacterium]